MRYEFKPSFDRTFKKLSPKRQEKIKEAILALIGFFEEGKKTSGLGLKNLRGDFWGIRAGIKKRIIFLFAEDLASFLIVGSHDEIKRYLKNVK